MIIHSPTDIPEPNEQQEKWSKEQIQKLSMHDRELLILEYAQGAVKGGHAGTVDILIKMVMTRRDYFEAPMPNEFVTFVCQQIFKEYMGQRLRELKKLYKRQK